MSGARGSELVDAIEARYGSLNAPDYSFVERVAQDQPYEGLVQALSTVVDVEETTDLNDDVSFRYVISQASNCWALSLSMVGPYALLLRMTPPREVVTDQAAEGDERTLLRLLKEAGISVLSRAELEARIPFRPPGEGANDATIFQALISDEPLLPWQRAD